MAYTSHYFSPCAHSLIFMHSFMLNNYLVICSTMLLLTPDIYMINLLQTFNEIQKLLSKINGKVIGDVMTPAPLVVRETTNLEDAARL